jgi:protein-tyrosine-phosphatase
LSVPSLLFVCTGNTCRSPMAMTLFKARLAESEPQSAGWRVESAGTWAQDGSPAARYAREAMAARGLDLNRHQARTVTHELLNQFNLILVMETNHKEALCAEFPVLAGRIYLLSEMAGKQVSVDDPIGREPAEYVKCANLLDTWIENGWNNILKLS